jgi:hypothetical protein
VSPFAGMTWEECIAENQDKDDPEAYCGKIKHQVEDTIPKCVFTRMDCLEKKYPSIFTINQKLDMAYDFCQKNSDTKDFGNGAFFTHIQDLLGSENLKNLVEYKDVKGIWNIIRTIGSPTLYDKENDVEYEGNLYLKEVDFIVQDAKPFYGTKIGTGEPSVEKAAVRMKEAEERLKQVKKGNLPETPVSSSNVMSRAVRANKLYVRFHSSPESSYKYIFKSNEEALKAGDEITKESPGRFVWKNLRGKKLGPVFGKPKKLTPGGTSASIVPYDKSKYSRIKQYMGRVPELEKKVGSVEELAEKMRQYKMGVKKEDVPLEETEPGELEAKGKSGAPIRPGELEKFQKKIYEEKKARKGYKDEAKAMLEKLKKKKFPKIEKRKKTVINPKGAGKKKRKGRLTEAQREQQLEEVAGAGRHLPAEAKRYGKDLVEDEDFFSESDESDFDEDKFFDQLDKDIQYQKYSQEIYKISTKLDIHSVFYISNVELRDKESIKLKELERKRSERMEEIRTSLKEKKELKKYRYYLINRPPDIGTIPTGFSKKEAWDHKKEIPKFEKQKAHGWAEYTHKLTNKEISKFNLIPENKREWANFMFWFKNDKDPEKAKRMKEMYLQETITNLKEVSNQDPLARFALILKKENGKGKGKGWHGESERHSEAAKKGKKDFEDDFDCKGRWITVSGKRICIEKGQKLQFGKEGRFKVVSKKEYTEKKEKRIQKKIEKTGVERERAEESIKAKREKRKEETGYKKERSIEELKQKKAKIKEKIKKEPEKKSFWEKLLKQLEREIVYYYKRTKSSRGRKKDFEYLTEIIELEKKLEKYDFRMEDHLDEFYDYIKEQDFDTTKPGKWITTKYGKRVYIQDIEYYTEAELNPHARPDLRVSPILRIDKRIDLEKKGYKLDAINNTINSLPINLMKMVNEVRVYNKITQDPSMRSDRGKVPNAYKKVGWKRTYDQINGVYVIDDNNIILTPEAYWGTTRHEIAHAVWYGLKERDRIKFKELHKEQKSLMLKVARKLESEAKKYEKDSWEYLIRKERAEGIRYEANDVEEYFAEGFNRYYEAKAPIYSWQEKSYQKQPSSELAYFFRTRMKKYEKEKEVNPFEAITNII